MTIRTAILLIIALSIISAGGWWTIDRQYRRPIDDLKTRIASHQLALDKSSAATRDHATTIRQLRSFEGRSLGKDDEQVTHLLRVMLTEIAEQNQLRNISVDSSYKGVLTHPAARAGVRMLGDDDFVRARLPRVVEGTLRGDGTIKQVLGVIGMLQAQPWMKRITSVSLDPDDSGRQVELTLRMQTLFLPGATAQPDPTLLDLDEGDAQMIATISDRNMFAPPEPAPAKPTQVAAAKSPPPPPPTPPPLGDWKITGLVTGSSGPELMLYNTKSNQSMSLQAGQSLLSIEFIGQRGEMAVLRSPASSFMALPGETLANQDRKVDSQ